MILAFTTTMDGVGTDLGVGMVGIIGDGIVLILGIMVGDGTIVFITHTGDLHIMVLIISVMVMATVMDIAILMVTIEEVYLTTQEEEAQL